MADGAWPSLVDLSASNAPPVEVRAVADLDRAGRWVGTVRRVALVMFSTGPTGTHCRVRGQGRRLPFERSVPLEIGLGLGLLGVPTVLGAMFHTSGHEHPEPGCTGNGGDR